MFSAALRPKAMADCLAWAVMFSRIPTGPNSMVTRWATIRIRNGKTLSSYATPYRADTSTPANKNSVAPPAAVTMKMRLAAELVICCNRRELRVP